MTDHRGAGNHGAPKPGSQPLSDHDTPPPPVTHPGARLDTERSSFRDYAAERPHTPHAVMEAALAHVVRNKAEAAYVRSDLFEKRRALMESWSNGMPS